MPKNTLEALGLGRRAWLLFLAAPQTLCLLWRTGTAVTEGMLKVPWDKDIMRMVSAPLFVLFAQPAESHWFDLKEQGMYDAWVSSPDTFPHMQVTSTRSTTKSYRFTMISDHSHLFFSSFPISMELTQKNLLLSAHCWVAATVVGGISKSSIFQHSGIKVNLYPMEPDSSASSQWDTTVAFSSGKCWYIHIFFHYVLSKRTILPFWDGFMGLSSHIVLPPVNRSTCFYVKCDAKKD